MFLYSYLRTQTFKYCIQIIYKLPKTECSMPQNYDSKCIIYEITKLTSAYVRTLFWLHIYMPDHGPQKGRKV